MTNVAASTASTASTFDFIGEDREDRLAYVREARPLEGLDGLCMNESYRRGRSVLERAAVANAPSPTLSAADCADVMHLIRSSELPTDETADAGLRHAQRLVEHFLRSTDSAV